MKKIAIYARVSTDKQSVDSQLNDLKKYAAQRNFEIYKEYIDVASGAKEQRPALNELMNDAKKRYFDMVLVFRFDRFARSTKHLVNALAEFESDGIDFISFNESIDTSSPMGKMIFTIIGAMAEMERSIIRERVRSGIQTARGKGKILGRPIKRDDQKIIELRNSGYSIRKIASLLQTSIASVQRGILSSSTSVSNHE